MPLNSNSVIRLNHGLQSAGAKYSSTLESPFIPTFTGKVFNVEVPSSHDISIRDIAHSLSMQCRFGGHCQQFYSAAEHSVILSRLVEKEFAMCALLHESSHAYIHDVVITLQYLLPGYLEMANRIWAMVAKRFHLPSVIPLAIRNVDLRLRASEIEYLLLPSTRTWLQGVTPFTLEELGVRHSKQLGMLPREANRQFLARFAELVI
uniref:Uncharacterized protein n=1 Tax=Desulfovibrio sp. U5L TaxID=596152 RepID=I2Q003_9BACT